jgi:response regulator of citrate/malate metabolism
MSSFLSLKIRRAEKVPKGYKTTQQIADECGRSRAQTARLLLVGVRNGEVECKNFVITTGQVTRPVPHYRMK